MEYKDFAKNLRELQIEKGIKTQVDFAKYIGVSKSFISVLLLGEKLPSMDTALGMCEKFDVNLDWLMRNKGDKRQGSADISQKKLITNYEMLSKEQKAAVDQVVSVFIQAQSQSQDKPREMQQNEALPLPDDWIARSKNRRSSTQRRIDDQVAALRTEPRTDERFHDLIQRYKENTKE